MPDWVVPVVVAPFVGSFLGLLVVRLPAGANVVTGRSVCPACGHKLTPVDLVPILSWLWAGGRCRHCDAPIDRIHPMVELAALAAALWASTIVEGWILWASCALGWTLIALAAIDWRHMILPDSLTLPLAAGGVGIAALLGGGALQGSLVGGAVGFAVFAAIGAAYRRLRGREGLGLGDAKLLGAAGAWVSWMGLSTVVAVAALAALAVAAAQGWRSGGFSPTARIPFGAYLCGAIWLVWLYGPFTSA